jgi:hypothetical protein
MPEKADMIEVENAASPGNKYRVNRAKYTWRCTDGGFVRRG